MGLDKIKTKQQKIFLMDMENVGCNGLIGAEQLSKNDEIHIFIGKCTDKIKINFLSNLQGKGVNLVFHDIACTGKNALDFQIVSLLSILVANHEDAKFYVVTRDKGFDSSICFLKHYYSERRLSITRLSAINDIFIKKAEFQQLVERNLSVTSPPASIVGDPIPLTSSIVAHNQSTLLVTKCRADQVDILVDLKKEEEVLKQGVKSAIMSYISSFISYPAWMSEKQKQIATKFFYQGCREEKVAKARKRIEEKCISAFGKEKGHEIYGSNKNILDSLYKKVRLLLPSNTNK